MSFNTKKYTKVLINGGDVSTNLSAETCLFYSKQWSVFIELIDLLGEPPILNLFHSIDGVNWVLIEDCIKDLILTENLIIQDEYFPNNYLKVTIDPTGESSGTVNVTLNLKTQ